MGKGNSLEFERAVSDPVCESFPLPLGGQLLLSLLSSGEGENQSSVLSCPPGKGALVRHHGLSPSGWGAALNPGSGRAFPKGTDDLVPC